MARPHGTAGPLETARAWAGTRPGLVDALLAVIVYVVLTLGVSTPAEDDGAWWLGPLCNLAPVVPLAWRRRAPLTVLAVSVGSVVVLITTVGAMGAEAASVAALATAVSRVPSPRLAAAAAAATAAAIVVAVVVAAPADPATGLVNGMSGWLVGCALGVAARARRSELVAVAERGTREAALAVAAERARVARDVHDVVSHNVAVLVALADGIEQTIDRDPARARAAAGEAATVGREALGELRGLLGVLADGAQEPTPVSARHLGAEPAPASPPRPGTPRAGEPVSPLAPQPGAGDLGALVARAHLAGLDARLRTSGDPELAPAGVQLTLYRVAQEAITNVLRHADGATRVDVDVRRHAGAIELEVADDGRQAATRPDGRGIAGMRERAALHEGAAVAAGPDGGGGWRVALRIPR